MSSSVVFLRYEGYYFIASQAEYLSSAQDSMMVSRLMLFQIGNNQFFVTQFIERGLRLIESRLIQIEDLIRSLGIKLNTYLDLKSHGKCHAQKGDSQWSMNQRRILFTTYHRGESNNIQRKDPHNYLIIFVSPFRSHCR